MLILSIVFLCLSVTLLAQAAITIYTYNKDKKAKDLNFYWSCLVLVLSIIGVIASGFGIFANRGAASGAVANSGKNLSAQQLSLANKLEMEAASSAARAAKAAEGAKLANALGATVGQLEK